MYRSPAAVEQEARKSALSDDDLERCRICGACYMVHYWQCDDSSKLAFKFQNYDAALMQPQEHGMLLNSYYSYASVIDRVLDHV